MFLLINSKSLETASPLHEPLSFKFFFDKTFFLKESFIHYIIAEKNTAARRIASFLADGRGVKRRKIGKIEAYEVDGKVVIGLSGHIVGLDFPAEYSNWSKVNPQELIDAKIIKIPIRKDIVKALEHIAKDADEITIATDYDREGELIGVEALNIIKRKNPKVKVSRMRYSAITESAIKESFANRTSIDYNLAASAEAREIIDLIWGASLTRFLSLSANQMGENFLSVGRVQSPTLAILVDKEKEIENFVPSKYWKIQAKVRTQRGEVFDVEHEGGKFEDKRRAEEIKSRIEAVREGIIKDVKESLKREKPPTPFDTTEFIRAAAIINFSPMKAMNVAESLYLKGFISYHRTDNTVYPPSLDIKGIVRMFINSEDFGEYAKKLLKREIKPTAGKKKTTDHPPIHPVSALSADEKLKLSEDERKIYELVVRRFFATLSEDAKWRSKKVEVEIGNEKLVGKGRELKEPGFLDVYHYHKREEKRLPELEKGEKVEVVEVEVVEKETEPPKRLSSSALIKKMEELGLGTKSTRHEIISKLYARTYVQGNPLRPTKKAFAIIAALRKYGSLITKPEMTSELEKEMDAISDGKKRKEEVVEKSRKMLREVFKEMMKNREEIAKMLKEGLRGDKMIGVCPKCGNELLLMNSKKGKRFIGCSNYPRCRFSLPLPKSGRLIVVNEECEEHGLRKIKLIEKKKSWSLGCPYCNFLQWEKKEKQ
ncbi:MAG: DNA topoisomerase I [Candidatus Methanospirareceae archaeon]